MLLKHLDKPQHEPRSHRHGPFSPFGHDSDDDEYDEYDDEDDYYYDSDDDDFMDFEDLAFYLWVLYYSHRENKVFNCRLSGFCSSKHNEDVIVILTSDMLACVSTLRLSREKTVNSYIKQNSATIMVLKYLMNHLRNTRLAFVK